MCTAFTTQHDSHRWFGRNLDLDTGFGESVVITPRGYVIPYRCQSPKATQYGMIGMANVIDGYPLYAEALNEHGLVMAGLYFPGYTHYDSTSLEGSLSLTPYELIPYIVGSFRTVAEARPTLEKLQLVAIPFSATIPVTPLHFFLSDGQTSIVIESTSSGVHIYDNPIHLLTNSPEFPYHLTSLGQHINLSALQAGNRFAPKLQLHPYGVGAGAMGLPGDATPNSRFIRGAFLLHNSMASPTDASQLARTFRILDALQMIKGTVYNQAGAPEYTIYSVAANLNDGTFYYKTYDNLTIQQHRLQDVNLDAPTLYSFPIQ